MAGRYDAPPPPSFGRGSTFASRPAPKPKDDPLERFLRFGSAAAPLAGTLIGAGIGTAVAPGAGTVAGAGIGGAAGSLGGLGLGAAADERARPEEEAELERVRKEQEEAAKAQAALRILGGF